MSVGDPPGGSRRRVLSETERLHLAGLGSSHEFPRGEEVVREGSRGDTMYIIEKGAVDFYFEAGRGAKRLYEGEFFGELALLTGDQLRTATAVTASDASLRVIDQEAFEGFLRSSPQAAVQLLRRTCIYLLDSEQGLVSDLTLRNRDLEQALDYLRRTKEDLDTTQLMTLTDELTGLYNRRCLNRQSSLLIDGAERALGLVSLLVIDSDDFKQVNDSCGHAIGDLVLRRLAEVLRSSLRQTDLPCRLGGDEFAILLVHQSEEESLATALRLLERIAMMAINVPGGEVRITCSIGGCVHGSGEDWETFFDRADRSLYLAKQEGRNRVGWDGKIVAEGESGAQRS